MSPDPFLGLLVAALIGVLCGALLITHRVAAPAGGLLAASGGVLAVGSWVLARDPGSWAGTWLLVFGSLVLVPLTVWAYPAPLWRHPVDFALAVATVGPGAVALLPGLAWDAVGVLAFTACCTVVVQTWWRLERAAPGDRRPLAWFALGGVSGAVVVAMLGFLTDGAPWPATLGLAALGVVPVAMVVGVVNPDVVDVRALVVQAVVLILVVVLYLAYFVGVVSAFAMAGVVDLSPAALGAVGLVGALLLRPATLVLRGVIDQMLFGDRPDPLHAAERLAGRLGDDPELALAAVRDGLALPYVALTEAGAVLASSGAEITATRAFDLPGRAGATLVAGLRPGDLRLSEGDERVLRLVAPLLAHLVRAHELTAAVQTSREQAIARVEEERRRLRRDLHDGLGPTLSGIAFALDAVRNTVRSDPDAAVALVEEARRDTAGAVGEIRRIVYAMRPPALDEVGLVPALRQQALGLRGRHGSALSVVVESDGALPELPAAVEVAAYRIAVEALTNVARHAGGSRARAALRVVDGALVLEVEDDGPPAAGAGAGTGAGVPAAGAGAGAGAGVQAAGAGAGAGTGAGAGAGTGAGAGAGVPGAGAGAGAGAGVWGAGVSGVGGGGPATEGSGWQPGVGIASMRERAAELGGTLECGATSSGGRVRAVLPLSS